MTPQIKPLVFARLEDQTFCLVDDRHAEKSHRLALDLRDSKSFACTFGNCLWIFKQIQKAAIKE